jgi:hypothetical protein
MKRVYIGLITMMMTHHESSDIYPVLCIVYV